jgi:HSP20 family protein
MTWANQLPTLFRDSFETQVDRLLDEALHSMERWSSTWAPQCDVYEDDHGFCIRMALPGVDAKDLDVQVDQNTLMVKGGRTNEVPENRRFYVHEIPYGPFSCSFRIPSYVDQDKVTTSFKEGILTIEFPKCEEAKPRRIMIESR